MILFSEPLTRVQEMQYLRRVHLQREEVQCPEGDGRWRGLLWDKDIQVLY